MANQSNPVSSPAKRTSRLRMLVNRLAVGLALTIAFLYSVYPLVATALDGFGANIAALFVGNNVVEIASAPFAQGIFTFTWVHYADALTLGAFPTRVWNSLIIGAISVAVALVAGIPVSYVLARVDIKGRTAISYILLGLRTVSPFAVVLPLYILFTRIGLWDTYQGVALAELLLILTVVVWMVKGFFQDIPKPIYDAASIFGASEAQILLRVALPIVFTGIAITAIFGFVLVWNEYLIQVVMTGPATQPVSVGVFGGIGALNKTPDFIDIETAATIAFIPVAIVMIAIRKYLAKGFSLATAR